MPIRIVINGQEVTNPFAKALLVLGAIIIAAIVAAVKNLPMWYYEA